MADWCCPVRPAVKCARAALLLGAVLAVVAPTEAQSTVSPTANPTVKAAVSSPARASVSTALTLRGTWRVTRGTAAPWITDKKYHPDTTSWIGQSVRFDATRVTGPEALACGSARYEATSVPAEGMFQGGLQTSPKTQAMSVGVGKFPVAGTSLSCDTGVFEFHFPDSSSALLAMSNVIWTLDRSPGALAAATTPSGVVQRFLEAHFAGDMGFAKSAVQPKSRFITAGLNALMNRYFALPANPNEAPEINGDPFTDSQEYPTRFSVSIPTSSTTGSTTTASVSVRFSDAVRVQRLAYVLRLENGVWRIDDVKDASGVSLRASLMAALPRAR